MSMQTSRLVDMYSLIWLHRWFKSPKYVINYSWEALKKAPNHITELEDGWLIGLMNEANDATKPQKSLLYMRCLKDIGRTKNNR